MDASETDLSVDGTYIVKTSKIDEMDLTNMYKEQFDVSSETTFVREPDEIFEKLRLGLSQGKDLADVATMLVHKASDVSAEKLQELMRSVVPVTCKNIPMQYISPFCEGVCISTLLHMSKGCENFIL